MSEFQQTESEFTVHPFLTQEFEPERLLPFPPNLLLKHSDSSLKSLSMTTVGKLVNSADKSFVWAMVKFYYSAAA